MGVLSPDPERLDRRSFLRGAAGAAIGAGVTSTLGGPAVALADVGHNARVVPVPKPIPGGLPVGLPAPYDLIHIFLPGPTNVTLPFSGSQLQGLNVDPSVIGDFKGRTALAYLIGSAIGSDGVTYGLEADVRAFEGRYRQGGARRWGTFALL
jgi:hypothetical protein